MMWPGVLPGAAPGGSGCDTDVGAGDGFCAVWGAAAGCGGVDGAGAAVSVDAGAGCGCVDAGTGAGCVDAGVAGAGVPGLVQITCPRAAALSTRANRIASVPLVCLLEILIPPPAPERSNSATAHRGP